MVIFNPGERHWLLVFEAVLMALVLAVVVLAPRLSVGWCRALERGLRRLARRRALSMWLVAGSAFAISAAVSLLISFPQPRFHDEFAYLLSADTFAHGRLANPPHRFWEHFESFHIIQQPTYASKYGPGQGLLLAVGQVVGGHPAVGLWLGAALACATIYWMLLAWLPPWWALLGGWLAVLRIATFSYWSQSYWGGAVGVIGGALVLGAVRRIVRRPRARDAALLALGFVILGASRPYEGFLLALPVLAALAVALLARTRPPLSVWVTRVVVPAGVVLAVGVGAMGVYNARVTGHALTMPYQIHEATYAVAPLFIWGDRRPEPAYRHEVMREFHVNASLFGALGGRSYEKQRGVKGFIRASARKVQSLFVFYLGIVLAVPLLTLPWLVRDRWMLFALVTLGIIVLGLFTVTSFHPHYASPVTGLVFALVIQGMRHLRLWRFRGRPAGRVIAWSIPMIALATVGLAAVLFVREDSSAWQRQRARILSQLTSGPERHLVIVRYEADHPTGQEWVYNEADIDGAKVVWARDMGPERDRALVDYFKDRRAWVLDADAKKRQLVPYDAAKG